MKRKKILLSLVLTALAIVAVLAFVAADTGTVVTTWTRVPASGNIGTTTNNLGGAVYGAYVQAQKAFTTARTDTFFFPFVIPYPKDPSDTVGIVFNTVTVVPTDTGNVLWSCRYSTDYAHWSVWEDLQRDSGATAATTVTTWNRGHYKGWWYKPYGELRAIGKPALSGGVANKAGVIARVELLNTQ